MTMSDFTLFLPCEIFTEILSHVNQEDCMECMAVCRRWHKLIPQHAKDVWKELEISEKSWSRFNNAISQCLIYVEKVSFLTPQNAHKKLQRLERQGCNIQSLEIKDMSGKYILGLDRIIVFDGIGLFRKSLRELFIYVRKPCTHYFSLPTLLGLLPALTHLHLTTRNTNNWIYAPPQDEEPINDEIQHYSDSNDNNKNENEMYGLVFLYFECDCVPEFQIKQIIQRCPQLTYLLAPAFYLYDFPVEGPIEFEHIIELCPSIRYIHWGEDNSDTTSEIEKRWLALSRRKSGYTDIKNTSDYETRGENHLRQVGFGSRDEERHISALATCLQQPSLLEHLRLYGSYRIGLCSLWNRFTQHNSNLLSQLLQLKSLHLSGFCVPHQIENSIFFENFFSHFQHIERLKVGLLVSHIDNVDKEPNSISKMFEAIGHQLPQLQCLHIDLSGVGDIDTKIILRDNLFTTLCDGNQKLEILHLGFVPISNDMLLDLCHHPKLHTLSLSDYERYRRLTKDGLILFARELKKQEKRGCGRIQSILLSCCSYAGVRIQPVLPSSSSDGSVRIRSIVRVCSPYDSVTDKVLQELAGVKSLKTLQVQYTDNITDAGVNRFASIKSSISKKNTKIELYNCKKVSSDNPYVLFVSSPFPRYIY